MGEGVEAQVSHAHLNDRTIIESPILQTPLRGTPASGSAALVLGRCRLQLLKEASLARRMQPVGNCRLSTDLPACPTCPLRKFHDWAQTFFLTPLNRRVDRHMLQGSVPTQQSLQYNSQDCRPRSSADIALRWQLHLSTGPQVRGDRRPRVGW